MGTGSGSGSVTSVATGTGLTGGPVTTTGTISLANTAVTVGSYTHATITVDAQGRVTVAGSGAAISLTLDVSGLLPIANGRTNAATASDARTNLGLGTAAVVNTGTSAGNIPVLDGGAKLPASMLGVSGLTYLGSISLTNGQMVTPLGSCNYYVVSNIATIPENGLDGGTSISFSAGGWMISNGTVWQKITNSTEVSSVAGKTGAVTLACSDITTGTVAIANCGTGSATAAGAINALLPTQTSNSGNYLTTNGSAASWGTLTSSQWTTNGSNIYYNTGNVGIGTATQAQKLDAAGNIKITNQTGAVATPDKIDWGASYSNGARRDQWKIYLNDGGGIQRYGFGIGSSSDIQYHSQVTHDFYVNNANSYSISASGGANSSDRRLKRDILPLSKYGLKQVMQLNPVTYIFKADNTNTQQVGFIAQEVQQIIAEVVTGKEGDLSKGESLGIVYDNLVPVLTKAIQGQQATIVAQQKQIDELKKMVELLMKK